MDSAIGIGTTFDYSIPLEPMFEMIARAGFRATTLGAGNVPHSGYDTEDGRKRIRELTARYGLRVDSVHAPFGAQCDISLPDVEVAGMSLDAEIRREDAETRGRGDAGISVSPLESGPQTTILTCPVPQSPPAAPEPGNQSRHTRRAISPERRAAIDRVRNAIGAAEAIGSGIVILHVTDRFPPEETRARISAVKDSLKELIPYAMKKGIQLAAENLPSALAMQVFHAALEDQPGLGVCYDSSHARISGDGFDVLQRYRERVIALHISDNRGKNDDHMLPFEGVIEWPEFAQYLGRLPQIGILMLEVEVRESAFRDSQEFLAQAAARAKRLIWLATQK
jgi:sugar phosphate isomerase/epimerase